MYITMCVQYRVIEGRIPSLSLSSLFAIVYNVCTVQGARTKDSIVCHFIVYVPLYNVYNNVCTVQGDRRNNS